MNCKGIKEEILLGCNGLDAALWKQLNRERSFLVWAYACTLAHHVQDTAGLLHFLNVSEIIIILF